MGHYGKGQKSLFPEVGGTDKLHVPFCMPAQKPDCFRLIVYANRRATLILRVGLWSGERLLIGWAVLQGWQPKGQSLSHSFCTPETSRTSLVIRFQRGSLCFGDRFWNCRTGSIRSHQRPNPLLSSLPSLKQTSVIIMTDVPGTPSGTEFSGDRSPENGQQHISQASKYRADADGTQPYYKVEPSLEDVPTRRNQEESGTSKESLLPEEPAGENILHGKTFPLLSSIVLIYKPPFFHPF